MAAVVVTVPLKDAQVGVRLARDVRDASGRRLLAAGSVLSAETLALLARRGIAAVAIERTLDAAAASARIEEIERQLARRFRGVEDNALMRELKEVLRGYCLGDAG